MISNKPLEIGPVSLSFRIAKPREYAQQQERRVAVVMLLKRKGEWARERDTVSLRKDARPGGDPSNSNATRPE